MASGEVPGRFRASPVKRRWPFCLAGYGSGCQEPGDLGRLDAAASDHEQVRWHWVKGHIGHELNERADVLAVAATPTAARSAR
jgi:hypothetical protein